MTTSDDHTRDAEQLKREKQQKALGAAFLAHQVSQLENTFDSLQFSRSSTTSNARSKRGGGGGEGRGALRRGPGGAQTPSSTAAPGGARPIKLVDPSALVHALPVLKRWVRENRFQLVVPLSALATLDILKKAPAPLNDLAREATRFLEAQFDIAKQIDAVYPRGTEQNRARVRLRAQSSHEELAWNKLEGWFRVPEGYRTELPPCPDINNDDGTLPEVIEEPLPLPTMNDVPRSIRSTLQCFLYFFQQEREQSSSIVGDRRTSIALHESHLPVPPPIPSTLMALLPSTPSSTSSPNQLDFDSLASGDVLAYYLSTFFALTRNEISSISPQEVTDAKQWFAKHQKQQQARSPAAVRGGKGGEETRHADRGGRGGDRARGGGAGGTRGRDSSSSSSTQLSRNTSVATKTLFKP